MRLATLLCVTSVLGGCTILTDLDDYRVRDGDASMDSGEEEVIPQDCVANSFTVATDWTVDTRGSEILPAGARILVGLAGTPAGDDNTRIVATATFRDSADGTAFVLPRAIPSGRFTAFVFADLNGEPGFQPGEDRAWQPGLCSDNTTYLRARVDTLIDPNTVFSEGNPTFVRESLSRLDFDIGGAHGEGYFEVAFANPDRSRVFGWHSVQEVPPSGTRFETLFPRALPDGRYIAFAYALFSTAKSKSISTESSHRWDFPFNVADGQVTFEDSEGLVISPPEPPLFDHSGPTSRFKPEDWPMRYEPMR